MTRAYDLALMGMVLGMFITLLVCIGVVGFYAYRVTNADYRYELLQQDYTRLISQSERSNEIRYNRLQEQLNSLQFTTGKRIDLLQDQINLYRREKNK